MPLWKVNGYSTFHNHSLRESGRRILADPDFAERPAHPLTTLRTDSELDLNLADVNAKAIREFPLHPIVKAIIRVINF